jgi:hypothetical protein
MAEQKNGKDVEVKEASATGDVKSDSKNSTQELLKIQEVRMLIYIIPVVLISLLIAYLVKIF